MSVSSSAAASLLEPPVLRMHDLEPERPAAHFAETAQARAARQAALLRGGEIEEAQRQEAGAVGDAPQQLPPAAIHDLGELHLAFDRHAHAGQRARRCGTICVRSS